METLTKESLIMINETLAHNENLEPKCEDETLLESMINTIYSTYKTADNGDYYVYANPHHKAGKLLHLFQDNSPFANCNIRTGIISALTLLSISDIKMEQLFN